MQKWYVETTSGMGGVREKKKNGCGGEFMYDTFDTL
jgi:hypothetical protein